jgi:NADH dehydrogenase [ubiquinone] 1 alpha subcomplex assembly factor 5
VNNSSIIFDRRQVRLMRESTISLPQSHEFLHQDLEKKLSCRVQEFKKPFHHILILGAKTSCFHENLTGQLYFYDFAPQLNSKVHSIVGDEEHIPFAENSFDLVISAAHLHHVNDIKGCLFQLQKTLKPGGMIIGNVIGEMSLAHLRHHFIVRELALGLGNVPRIAPMLELSSLARLLTIAGFQDPVCDVESYSLAYSNLKKFVEDLRAMGETNVMMERHKGLSRKAVGEMFTHGDVPIELEYIFFAGVK